MRTIDIIIGVCWIAFWVYWIVSAFGTKRSIVSTDTKLFAVSRLGLIALAALFIFLARSFSISLSTHPFGSNNIVLVIGLVLFMLGLMLAVWARIYLGKNWGFPMTEKAEPELVTSGPYTYIRHPIYTGILCMALGSAFDINTYWYIVLLVFAIYFTFSATVEERYLQKEFPKQYPAYKHKTKMLVPFLF